MNSRELQHGADATTGDHAGTGRGRLQEHAAGPEDAGRLVGDRRAVLRNPIEVLLRLLDTLLDSNGNLVGLAVSDTDHLRSSPTTTSAVNEKRRPPLTTFATR